MPGGQTVFVSGETTRKVFRWNDAVAALQNAYARPDDHAAAPRRSIAQSGNAWLRSLPAAPVGGRYFGAKLMGMAMAAELPGVEYVIVLFDRQTSKIAAFLDANLLTGFRTAATSAAAVDRLAPAGGATLGIIGSGLEAAMHARAFASIRPLDEVVVFSPTPEKREAFAQALTRDTGVAARAVDSAQAAAAGASIVLAAARSRGELPTLYADWLAPRATLVSIGSTIPQQREIDVSVVDWADLIICDTLDEVLEDTGDMLAAQQAGIDPRSKSHSLGALMRGEIDALRAEARRPMFKSVGGGLQDIVIAEMILEKALEAGLAQPLPIDFDTKL